MISFKERVGLKVSCESGRVRLLISALCDVQDVAWHYTIYDLFYMCVVRLTLQFFSLSLYIIYYQRPVF